MKTSKELKILAIDPATVFGYCFDPGVTSCSGVISLGERGSSKGKRLIDFYAHVERLIAAYQPDLIAYERPGGMHFTGMQFHCHLEAVILVISEIRKIPVYPVASKSVKKFITGSGNANKQAMVEKIKETYPHVTDHNEADAIGVYLYTKETYQ